MLKALRCVLTVPQSSLSLPDIVNTVTTASIESHVQDGVDLKIFATRAEGGGGISAGAVAGEAPSILPCITWKTTY